MGNASGPSRSTQRRQRRRVLLWAIAIIIVLLGAGYAFIQRPWDPRPLAVAVERVTPKAVTQALAVNGRIAARESVTLRAAVSALAADVRASEGDQVEAGTVLVVLDAFQAQAVVDQARAALEGGRIKAQQAEAAAERARALGENTSRSNREDAELAQVAATSEVTRLEAALEQAESQLALYTVVAPLSGTVLTRPVQRGQLVDPQTELMTIADLTDVIVETDVDELYSSDMQAGLKALLMPAGHTVAREGHVVFAAPKIDPSTGGRAVRIAFDEPADLPVGLTVNANIVVDEVDNALSIPRGALIIDGTDARVMVIADGVATERAITFDDWPAERVVVTSGLAEGDLVILDPTKVAAGRPVAAAE